jgi:hypothetical protein
MRPHSRTCSSASWRQRTPCAFSAEATCPTWSRCAPANDSATSHRRSGLASGSAPPLAAVMTIESPTRSPRKTSSRHARCDCPGIDRLLTRGPAGDASGTSGAASSRSASASCRPLSLPVSSWSSPATPSAYGDLPSTQLKGVVSVRISRITQVGTKVLLSSYLRLAPLGSSWLTLVAKRETAGSVEGDEFRAQYPGPIPRWPRAPGCGGGNHETCSRRPGCAVPRLRSDRARGPHRTGLSCAGRGPGQPARTLARGQPAPRPY